MRQCPRELYTEQEVERMEEARRLAEERPAQNGSLNLAWPIENVVNDDFSWGAGTGEPIAS